MKVNFDTRYGTGITLFLLLFLIKVGWLDSCDFAPLDDLAWLEWLKIKCTKLDYGLKNRESVTYIRYATELIVGAFDLHFDALTDFHGGHSLWLKLQLHDFWLELPKIVAWTSWVLLVASRWTLWLLSTMKDHWLLLLRKALLGHIVYLWMDKHLHKVIHVLVEVLAVAKLWVVCRQIVMRLLLLRWASTRLLTFHMLNLF